MPIQFDDSEEDMAISRDTPVQTDVHDGLKQQHPCAIDI